MFRFLLPLEHLEHREPGKVFQAAPPQKWRSSAVFRGVEHLEHPGTPVFGQSPRRSVKSALSFCTPVIQDGGGQMVETYFSVSWDIHCP